MEELQKCRVKVSTLTFIIHMLWEILIVELVVSAVAEKMHV